MFTIKNTLSFAGLLACAALVVTPAVAQGPAGNGDDAFTLWSVVFNHPESCTDPCNEDDLFVDPSGPQTAVIYTAGVRVQSNGRVALGGSLAEGSALGSLPVGAANQLFDADAAEIHLILRTHGDYLPGIADQQITSFAGGCDVQHCEDLQFAIFRPRDVGPGGTQTATVHRFDGSVVSGAWATLIREADGVRMAIHSRLAD